MIIEFEHVHSHSKILINTRLVASVEFKEDKLNEADGNKYSVIITFIYGGTKTYRFANKKQAENLYNKFNIAVYGGDSNASV